MTTTIPGIYKQGRIELLETPVGVREGPVLITLQELSEQALEPDSPLWQVFRGKRVDGGGFPDC